MVAAPDDERGSVVRAVVVLRDGYRRQRALVQALQDHVKQTTAPYKYPRIVDFADGPARRPPPGKVRRAALRRLSLGRADALDREARSDSAHPARARLQLGREARPALGTAGVLGDVRPPLPSAQRLADPAGRHRSRAYRLRRRSRSTGGSSARVLVGERREHVARAVREVEPAQQLAVVLETACSASRTQSAKRSSSQRRRAAPRDGSSSSHVIAIAGGSGAGRA